MEWLRHIDWVQAANALVILIVGLAAGLGVRKKGGAVPAKAELEIQTQGAIIDSSSVKQAAIELSGLAGAVTDHKDELEEVRHAINQLREAIDRFVLETARRR